MKVTTRIQALIYMNMRSVLVCKSGYSQVILRLSYQIHARQTAKYGDIVSLLVKAA
jgi:hypothetical protein